MIEQQLYFAPVYLAEALTVGLFFESLFSAKRSALGRWSTFLSVTVQLGCYFLLILYKSTFSCSLPAQRFLYTQATV